jgi:CBS domain containing-hemolysin-like protein
MSGLLLVAAVLLLLASALLSAAETAAFSIGESRLRTLSAEGFHGADALRTLRTQRPALRETLGLLESLLDLFALACVGAWGWGVGDRTSTTLALLLSVLTIFLFAEILPRAVAARWPIRLALRGAPLLLLIERWVRVALSPALRIERHREAGRGRRRGRGRGDYRRA